MSYAEKVDADLAAWIKANVTFPCSMVDRIVPALTDESRELIRARLGFDDPNGIVAEPFRQWVIEGQFRQGPSRLGRGRRPVRRGCRAL